VATLQSALEESKKNGAELQKQLTALAAQGKTKDKDVTTLQSALEESKKSGAELQKQLTALAAQGKTKDKDVTTLQSALEESKKSGAELQKQLTALTAQGKTKEKDAAALQSELEESKKGALALKKQLADQAKGQEKEHAALQQELAALKKEWAARKDVVAPPKTANEIRDYAIGSSLGNDVLALLQEKIAQGIKINERMAFSGVQDALVGQNKLAQDKIAKALYETEMALNEKEKKLKADTERQGLRYVEQFRKNKSVKKSSSGFYYRIDYLGAGKIDNSDTVAVVVKESLTNGKVIKDMDIAGTSISQPLSSYPVMFRDAIKQLQNHGTMTMVVPPELAYGDKGLAPDIPPGSTMVYNIRILDVLPADGAAGNKK
ncbi:TPA: FKBP-type peptidyl-prolyl cis-trans isomerase, partial [Serratia rubidaea]|nr:FKBP-type peptidyl-prolyl cis-trans isomerase [Serratia rubidaea]